MVAVPIVDHGPMPSPSPFVRPDRDEPGPLPADRSWTGEAACKGLTRLFFAPRAERPQARERREARARAVCSRCPVADTCRTQARAWHEYGFWGGESEEERHRAGYILSAPIGLRGRNSA